MILQIGHAAWSFGDINAARAWQTRFGSLPPNQLVDLRMAQIAEQSSKFRFKRPLGRVPGHGSAERAPHMSVGAWNEGSVGRECNPNCVMVADKEHFP